MTMSAVDFFNCKSAELAWNQQVKGIDAHLTIVRAQIATLKSTSSFCSCSSSTGPLDSISCTLPAAHKSTSSFLRDSQKKSHTCTDQLFV